MGYYFWSSENLIFYRKTSKSRYSKEKENCMCILSIFEGVENNYEGYITRFVVL